MFDTILDLPVHVLVVHAVVVLGPLAALTALLYAAWPALRRLLRWPLLVLGAIAAGSVFVATRSGEELERRVLADPALSEAQVERIGAHTDLGEAALLPLVLMFVVIVVCALWALAPGAGLVGAVRIAAAVALGAVAVWALVAVVRAGHSGSSAVWLVTAGG